MIKSFYQVIRLYKITNITLEDREISYFGFSYLSSTGIVNCEIRTSSFQKYTNREILTDLEKNHTRTTSPSLKINNIVSKIICKWINYVCAFSNEFTFFMNIDKETFQRKLEPYWIDRKRISRKSFKLIVKID